MSSGIVHTVQIGDLAKLCGVPTQTIRFYERRGLLPEPGRQPNGYRRYDKTSIERLAFIRRAQSAGLTLAEIRDVLDVRAEGRAPCSHVSQLLTSKLSEVEDRIGELGVLRNELTALVDRSRRLDPADCTTGEICHILQPAR